MHNRRAKSARLLQRANRLSPEGPNPKAAPPAARACLAHPSTTTRQTWDRPAQKARPAPPRKKAKPPGDVGASPSKPRATKRRLIRIFGIRMPLPQLQSAAASHSRNGRARAAIGCFLPSKRRGWGIDAPPQPKGERERAADKPGSAAKRQADANPAAKRWNDGIGKSGRRESQERQRTPNPTRSRPGFGARSSTAPPRKKNGASAV